MRAYYHQVLPFYDRELADRGDGELWTWAASDAGGLPRAGARVRDRTGHGLPRSHRRPRGGPGAGARDDRGRPPAPRRTGATSRSWPRTCASPPSWRGSIWWPPWTTRSSTCSRTTTVTARSPRRPAICGRAAVFCSTPPGSPPASGTRPADLPGLVKESTGADGLNVRETWRCDPQARLCTARFEYSRQGQASAGGLVSRAPLVARRAGAPRPGRRPAGGPPLGRLRPPPLGSRDVAAPDRRAGERLIQASNLHGAAGDEGHFRRNRQDSPLPGREC